MHIHGRLALSFATIVAAVSARRLSRRDSGFDWSSVNASSQISWTPCYNALECARLAVPLQYSNASAGEAQIALVSSPSNFSAGDPNYLGSILFNPGGPGGSGVQYLLQYETYFRAIIGPQYDLIGFDPRGVGETTPFLSVFESPAEALQFYATWPLTANDSVSSFGRLYAQSQILANLTLDRAKLVAESVGTAAVATDMLQIARALGQDKVNYWGVSYGSVLGATFAAMFPDNVGRLIIDGVSDSHQWYYQNQDNSSLVSTNAAVASIYDACVAAGPTLCAIWENTTELVSARVDRDLSVIQTTPLPVYNDNDPSAITFGVLDHAAALQALFQAVYFPYFGAPQATEALVALENGDGAPLYAASVESQVAQLTESGCPSDTQPFVAGQLDVSVPILCGDALVDRRRNLSEAHEDYEALHAISFFADVWYPSTIGPCAPWSIKAKDVFNGTFETATSTPILLIGNTFDPVTPLSSAKRMSEGFEGSVLLQQNSTGHTSLSGFSTCTALAIRAYFQNGTLPAPGTVCQPDTRIFESPTNSSGFGGVTISRREAAGLDLRDAAHLARDSTFLKRTWFPRGI